MAQTNGHSELPNVTYGFIGLGAMGFWMAGNLRKKIPSTSKLIICDVVKAQLDKFIAENKGPIEVAQNPKEVAEKADIILTSLPKGLHVKDVFTNPTTGILSAAKSSEPKLYIDTSTIDVPTSLEVADAVAASGLGKFVDAPVSGGPHGAKAATLTFMVGGPDEVVAEIKPIVMTMGKTFFHCGGLSSGLATKQINNYLAGICILGTAEAMNLGIKHGLDPKVLAGVINSSTGRSYQSIEQNPVKGISPNSPANNDFTTGFSIELCKGVLNMAVGLGERAGANLPLSKALIDTFEAASMDKRCAGKDCRGVWKFVADVD